MSRSAEREIDKSGNHAIGIRGVFSKLPEYEHEMVFVNDCSTDNSLELLLEARNGHSDIVVLNTSRNFGHMPGLFAGLRPLAGTP